MSEMKDVRTLADVIKTIEEGEFYRDYDQSASDLGILRAALEQAPKPAGGERPFSVAHVAASTSSSDAEVVPVGSTSTGVGPADMRTGPNLVAWRVHDFHVARQPVKAKDRFPEPTEYLYPADREEDAKETARLLNGICEPLFAAPPAPAPAALPSGGGVVPVAWDDPETRRRVIRLACQLWDGDYDSSCSWSEENREHYIIRAAMKFAASPEAPQASEEVRELATVFRPLVDALKDRADREGLNVEAESYLAKAEAALAKIGGDHD